MGIHKWQNRLKLLPSWGLYSKENGETVRKRAKTKNKTHCQMFIKPMEENTAEKEKGRYLCRLGDQETNQ